MHARYVRVGRHALWNLRRARAFRGERMAMQRLSKRRSSIVSHAALRCEQADVGLVAANGHAPCKARPRPWPPAQLCASFLSALACDAVADRRRLLLADFLHSQASIWLSVVYV